MCRILHENLNIYVSHRMGLIVLQTPVLLPPRYDITVGHRAQTSLCSLNKAIWLHSKSATNTFDVLRSERSLISKCAYIILAEHYYVWPSFEYRYFIEYICQYCS